jgi:hypothetical protein
VHPACRLHKQVEGIFPLHPLKPRRILWVGSGMPVLRGFRLGSLSGRRAWRVRRRQYVSWYVNCESADSAQEGVDADAAEFHGTTADEVPEMVLV